MRLGPLHNAGDQFMPNPELRPRLKVSSFVDGFLGVVQGGVLKNLPIKTMQRIQCIHMLTHLNRCIHQQACCPHIPQVVSPRATRAEQCAPSQQIAQQRRKEFLPFTLANGFYIRKVTPYAAAQGRQTAVTGSQNALQSGFFHPSFPAFGGHLSKIHGKQCLAWPFSHSSRIRGRLAVRCLQHLHQTQRRPAP